MNTKRPYIVWVLLAGFMAGVTGVEGAEMLGTAGCPAPAVVKAGDGALRGVEGMSLIKSAVALLPSMRPFSPRALQNSLDGASALARSL